MDPPGAQKNVIEIAESLGLSVSVAVSYEVSVKEPGNYSSLVYEVLMDYKSNQGSISKSHCLVLQNGGQVFK